MEVYFGWVEVNGHFLGVGGGGWKYILGEWEWVVVYGDEWGWSLLLV